MLFNIYVFSISVIFILLLYLLYLDKFSPSKIKIICGISIILFLIRYISVIILLLAHSMLHLYILKVPYFLNLLCGPVIVFILFYIFMRRNYIKFNYIFLLSSIVTAVYVFTMYNYTAVILGVDYFGYTMRFQNNTTIYWIFIIFNTIVLFGSIIFSQKSNVNKLGFYMIAVASFVTIAENLLYIIDVVLFPQNIFGDLCFICILLYALLKLKK